MLVVAGALHRDVVVRAPRLPREDETLRGTAVDYRFGGKGGNQALAAARAGAAVAFAGRVGADAAGAAMAGTLEAAGIDTVALQRGPGASGMSVAITAAGGSYGAVIVPGENRGLDLAALALPPGARMLLLQNELAPEALPALVAMGREAGLHVALNAAPAEGVGTWVLGALDTLIVNRLEALDLLGAAPGTLTPAEIVEGLQARAPRPDVIVTLGAEGVAFAPAGGPVTRAPAPGVTPVSTHGAGDVFCGTWAAARLAGADLAAAIARAQEAASAHVAAPRV